jgi:hypothetical protein
MTDAWLDERARDVRESIDALRRIKTELAYLQLGWRPPDGGWSIAQVIEHLIISDSLYLPELREVIANGKPGTAEWKPTMTGGFIIRALQPTSTRRTPAPRVFRPAEPRADVVDACIRVKEELAGLMESAKGVDLLRNKLHSPVSKLIRINLGDAFMILTVHTQRHLQQIARVRAHPDFPKA